MAHKALAKLGSPRPHGAADGVTTDGEHDKGVELASRESITTVGLRGWRRVHGDADGDDANDTNGNDGGVAGSGATSPFRTAHLGQHAVKASVQARQRRQQHRPAQRVTHAPLVASSDQRLSAVLSSRAHHGGGMPTANPLYKLKRTYSNASARRGRSSRRGRVPNVAPRGSPRRGRPASVHTPGGSDPRL